MIADTVLNRLEYISRVAGRPALSLGINERFVGAVAHLIRGSFTCIGVTMRLQSTLQVDSNVVG